MLLETEETSAPGAMQFRSAHESGGSGVVNPYVRVSSAWEAVKNAHIAIATSPPLSEDGLKEATIGAAAAIVRMRRCV